MADIDINAGLALKADINLLYGDIAGTLAQFKEDRRFNRKSYEELLDFNRRSVIVELVYLVGFFSDMVENRFHVL